MGHCLSGGGGGGFSPSLCFLPGLNDVPKPAIRASAGWVGGWVEGRLVLVILFFQQDLTVHVCVHESDLDQGNSIRKMERHAVPSYYCFSPT